MKQAISSSHSQALCCAILHSWKKKVLLSKYYILEPVLKCLHSFRGTSTPLLCKQKAKNATSAAFHGKMFTCRHGWSSSSESTEQHPDVFRPKSKFKIKQKIRIIQNSLYSVCNIRLHKHVCFKSFTRISSLLCNRLLKIALSLQYMCYLHIQSQNQKSEFLLV